jgi:hypothetical protein
MDGRPGLDGSIPWTDSGIPDTTPPWLVTASGCAATETTIGSLCVSTGPAGIAVRLWASEPVSAVARADPAGTLVTSTTVAMEHHLVIVPLQPDQEFSLSVRIEDLAGFSASEGPFQARTRAVVAPVVINEVLHDPLGPEPDQEFVELRNLGTSAVSLDGWVIADDGGSDTIAAPNPVPAGALVLIVSDGFLPGVGGDPVPGPGVMIIRLDGPIGAQGLRNSGEVVVLSDPSGDVVSTFPGLLNPPGPGISIERVHGLAPDGDPANWIANPGGTSTPGRMMNDE